MKDINTYEYYKKAWEKSLAEKTKEINDRIAVLEAEIEALQTITNRYQDALEYIQSECSSDNFIWRIADKALKGE